ncbi:MAG: hypothetical protein ACRDL5_14915, partial [Solirubrobacteraceae bacterium]
MRNGPLRVALLATLLLLGALAATAGAASWPTATELSLPTGASDGWPYLACPAQGSCVAAGWYTDASTNAEHPVVASESGGTWGAMTVLQLPAGASSPGYNDELGGVACGGIGSCAVAGVFETASGEMPLVASESGGIWGAGQALVLPDGAQGGEADAVACGGATSCAAVGDYTPGAGGPQAFVANQGGSGAWGAAQPVAPPTGGSYGTLTAVSCTAPGSCVAVGNYSDASGATRGMVVGETGGNWATTAQPVSPPADVLPSSANDGMTFGLTSCLQVGDCGGSISCPQTGDCTAVGSYVNTSDELTPMAATEANGSWGQAQAVPGLPAGQGGELGDVSCAAPGDCAAVSGELTPQTAVAAFQSGGTWGSAQSIGIDPQSVSCQSPGDCTAVGFNFDTSGNIQPLVTSSSDGAWGAPQEVSPPANAASGTGANAGNSLQGLSAVSCQSSGCTALGAYLAAGAAASVWEPMVSSVSFSAHPLTVPVDTARPVISGRPDHGRTLGCSTGGWTQAPTAFAYLWSRDGTPLIGATAHTYRVQQLDEGSRLTCTVTASNAAGAGGPATSAAVSVEVP